jgi:hypothetical protein
MLLSCESKELRNWLSNFAKAAGLWAVAEMVFFQTTASAFSLSEAPNLRAKHLPGGAAGIFLATAPAPKIRLAGLRANLTAETPNGVATEQRAVNTLAQLLKGHFAQSEKFAVQNGEGVKKREGDDFYPQ